MRSATEQDVEPIMGKLRAMLQYSPAPQMKYAEPEAAELSIKRAVAEGRGFFFGGYFVMVDVGSDWYTTKTYLIEQIILKVYDLGNADEYGWTTQDVITIGLPAIAFKFDAVAIAAGDTQCGMMTPKYHAAGFKTIGTQLFKEITYGVRT